MIEALLPAESPDFAGVSVLIVSWNARDYLEKCLESVHAIGDGLIHEIIVVDNASLDGSPEMVVEQFPKVRLIQTGGNLGFSCANNVGMREATGSLLALINSDVVVHPHCIETLVAYLKDNDDVGMVGPRIMGRDGVVQRTCRRIPTAWNYLCRTLAIDRVLSRFRLFSGYEMRHFSHQTEISPQVLSGCFWLVRKKAVEEVGGLDERFFFYMEDVDWCRRFSEAGWAIRFAPGASATHFGGGSSSNAPLRYMIEFHRANLKYWDKYYGLFGRIFYRAFAFTHHFVRLVPRSILRICRLDNSPEILHKIKEDIASLRWVILGLGV